MTEAPSSGAHAQGFDRGWAGHQRRQARIGLQLTHAQRLRWLEETMHELRGIVGRARYGAGGALP